MSFRTARSMQSFGDKFPIFDQSYHKTLVAEFFINDDGQVSGWRNGSHRLHINVVRKIATHCHAESSEKWMQANSISPLFSKDVLKMSTDLIISH